MTTTERTPEPERPPRDLPELFDWAVIRSVGALLRWNERRWRWDGREWQLIEVNR